MVQRTFKMYHSIRSPSALKASPRRKLFSFCLSENMRNDTQLPFLYINICNFLMNGVLGIYEKICNNLVFYIRTHRVLIDDICSQFHSILGSFLNTSVFRCVQLYYANLSQHRISLVSLSFRLLKRLSDSFFCAAETAL